MYTHVYTCMCICLCSIISIVQYNLLCYSIVWYSMVRHGATSGISRRTRANKTASAVRCDMVPCRALRASHLSKQLCNTSPPQGVQLPRYHD